MAGEIYAVSGEILTEIADAIRGKTGDDDFMTVSAFAAAVEGIPSGSGNLYWQEDTNNPRMYTETYNFPAAGVNNQGFDRMPRMKNFIAQNLSFTSCSAMFYADTQLEHVELPKITSGNFAYMFRECPSLKTAVFGSIGYPVTGFSSAYTFSYSAPSATITLYVSDDASLPLSGSPWGGGTMTFIYRSATTGEVIEI